MGRDALTRNLVGNLTVPTTSEDWDEWVSATATRNHILNDPLLDWLNRYGEEHGFVQDEVDEPYDFLTFRLEKRNSFEEAVVEHLRQQTDVHTILPQDAPHEARQDLAFAEATFAAMTEGVPVIQQGSLRDAETRTYGSPALLVRSDVLANLFPSSFSEPEAAVPAPVLDIGERHYRVVDIQYSTLDLTAGGELVNSGSAPAYKAQAYTYNHALGRLQGYLPPSAFVLGRGWKQTKRRVSIRGESCMERIASVSNDSRLGSKSPISHQVEQAVEWVRRMRREGEDWRALPEPSVDELRPNATGDAGTWSSAVKEIVKRIEELTQLYWVGVEGRRAANRAGITRWTDARVTPETLGVTGKSTAPLLRAHLEVNREPGPAVRPSHIRTARSEWIEEVPVEFYVDFETVNNLDDDFSRIPAKGGQPLIFMIGCGHQEAGNWQFECFIAERLDEPSEASVIDNWFDHMASVCDRLAPGIDPKIIHWSHHERTTLETAFDAAVKRHQQSGWQHTRRQQDWPRPNWFDFLRRVMKEEPVVVRGAHGFGLKAITRAMYDLGLVETHWDEGPADGLGAMAGAWWCDRRARETGTSMRDLEVMRAIEQYNEVDCRAMMELVQYLRRYH